MHHPDYAQIHHKIRHLTERPREWNSRKPFVHDDFCVYRLEFRSQNAHLLIPADRGVRRNEKFSYFLMREAPGPPQAGRRAKFGRSGRLTILLHGLNERFYRKYIPWAYQVWRGTRAPVVFFPLSFSINRVPPEWSKKQCREILHERAKERGVGRAHEFNAKISERLEACPERFFWGAVQSYWDIVDFVRRIRAGLNPHFRPDARIDFLGYSAGGYVALALLAVDHEGLFGDSRACLFATCVEMRDLTPASPYIADDAAVKAVRDLLVNHYDKPPSDAECLAHVADERMRRWLTDEAHPEGRWLHTFGGSLPDRAPRERRLRQLRKRLLGIANNNDSVIPPGPMRIALQGMNRDTGVTVEGLGLGIHESPFAFSDYPEPCSFSEAKFPMGIIEEPYRKKFERFVRLVVGHLGRGKPRQPVV